MKWRSVFFDVYCLALVLASALLIFIGHKTTIIMILDYIWEILNTDFGTAAAGSFFGALGGYIMVWYTNHRSEILSSIRHTKTAIAVSHSILNVFIGLKKQNIKSLCADYTENQSKFRRDSSDEIKISDEFRIAIDFTDISFPYLDLNLITSEFFDKTDLTQRAHSLALTLIRVIQELRAQVQYRKSTFDQIADMSSRLKLDEKGTACLLYGVAFPDARGNIMDFQNYSDVMKAIENFTDDCIWFSKELTLEFIEIANMQRRKIFIARPKKSSIDYSDVPEGLIPPDDNYKDWIEKFKRSGTQ